jgi:hypothetical protein
MAGPLDHAVATTQQQPKPKAQDEEREVEQESGTEEKPDVAPLGFIVELVDSASSLCERFKHRTIVAFCLSRDETFRGTLDIPYVLSQHAANSQAVSNTRT